MRDGKRYLGALLCLSVVCGSSVAGTTTAADVDPQTAAVPTPSAPDLSGRRHVGGASVYSEKLAGKEMADGSQLDPAGSAAASRTLPLGTRAKVTNLKTGQSAVVTIKDRGPYVRHRIVDLSPATASKIGISPEQGVATVAVAPIVVPLPGGKTKAGIAAGDTPSGDEHH